MQPHSRRTVSRILILLTVGLFAFSLFFSSPGMRGFTPDTVTGATKKKGGGGGGGGGGHNNGRNNRPAPPPKTSHVSGTIVKMAYGQFNTCIWVNSGSGQPKDIILGDYTKFTVNGKPLKRRIEIGDKVDVTMVGALAANVDVSEPIR